MTETKQCTGCKEVLPNTLEYFGRKFKGDDVHLLPKCKQCLKKKNQEWRKNNPEKSREKGRRWHHENLEHARALLRERARRRLAKLKQQQSA